MREGSSEGKVVNDRRREDAGVALVVGGYGAIGKTISNRLAQNGFTTVVAGRDHDKAKEVAAEIGAMEGTAAVAACFDATSVARMSDAISQIGQMHGPIAVLVNCIGMIGEQPMLEATEEVFDSVYQTNLRAAMFLGQTVARQQVAEGVHGRHIHILSVRSLLAFRGRGYSANVSTKAGLAVLLKQHATELAPYGITVNGVAPGAVRTIKNEQALADPDTLRRMTERIPLGRLATPADVATAVQFFASPDAGFVTGQVLFVDGGLTSCQ